MSCLRQSRNLRPQARRPLHSRCSSSRTALSEYPIRPRVARRAPAWITAGEARDVSSRDLGELSSDSRCRWDPLGNRINRNLGSEIEHAYVLRIWVRRGRTVGFDSWLNSRLVFQTAHVRDLSRHTFTKAVCSMYVMFEGYGPKGLHVRGGVVVL